MGNEIEVRSRLHEAIKKVDSALDKISEINETEYKTSGKFKWSPSSSSIACDVQNSRNVMDLLSIHSFLRKKRDDYNASAKLIGLDVFPVFKWQSYTVDYWLMDLTLRIRIVQQNDNQKELWETKKILEQHLSKDDQLEITLKSIGF